MADPEVTFRDFAGALMGSDDAKAAEVLARLLAVDAAVARSATAHFREQMNASPTFLQKAMGMRQVVEGGDAAGLAPLIGECFGLEQDAAEKAAEVVLARYR